MKTMKLAVSVYALTLVLATNNAVAAVGMASPSCDANVFDILYSDNMAGCDGYPSNSINSLISTGEKLWDATFTTMSELPSTGAGTCLGYELTGWIGDDLKISPLELGKEYTSNTNLWKTLPKPDGSSQYVLLADWAATTSTITLNANNANVAGSTAVYRKGTELYPNTNYDSVITSITVPKKYGYLFKGYFLTPERATAVENFWKNGTDNYAEYYCSNITVYPQEDWALGAEGVAAYCPWFASNGDIGNRYVGTAAAKIGETDLYAAWEPRNFTNAYSFGACTAMGSCEDKPVAGDIVAYNKDGTKINVSAFQNYAGQECRYNTGNCEFLATPTDKTGMFVFAGWEGTICLNGDCTSSTFGSIPLNADQVEQTDLSTIITPEGWKNIADTDTVQVLWTAKWKKANTLVNFYVDADATTPFVTYKAVTSATATELEKVKFYTLKEGTELTSEEVTVAPTMASNDTLGAVQGKTLRGFVINIDGKKANLATVAQDATSVIPYEDYLTSGLFLFSNDKGTFTNQLTHVLYGSASQPIIDALAAGDGSVNVYGVWAQNCDDEATLQSNKVDACSLHIGDAGQVWYVNTCDSGYHLENTTVDTVDNR